MVHVLMTYTVVKLYLKGNPTDNAGDRHEEKVTLQNREILGNSGSSMPQSFMSLDMTGIYHILKINVFQVFLVMTYVKNWSAS